MPIYDADPPTNPADRRPPGRRVLHVVRRGHLYLGLLLFPWAILYGVTAFLFNHPTAFADQPTCTFGREAAAGTPLDDTPAAAAVAELVLAKLNEQHKPPSPYALAGEARYDPRKFAFATVTAEGQSINVLYDLKTGGGTVREAPPAVEKAEPEKAPFATGPAKAPPGRGEKGGKVGGPKGGPPAAEGTGIKLSGQLHERLKAAVPTILDRVGFASGEVTVTSVPGVVFPVEADGRVWTATYDPITGAVTGAPAGREPTTELGWRRFLLRLHTAHGYPGELNARWYWAVVVDLMAGVMCFWGVSGLVMWWQIKATRRLGAAVLVLSAVAAAALGVAMHAALTGT